MCPHLHPVNPYSWTLAASCGQYLAHYLARFMHHPLTQRVHLCAYHATGPQHTAQKGFVLRRDKLLRGDKFQKHRRHPKIEAPNVANSGTKRSSCWKKMFI